MFFGVITTWKAGLHAELGGVGGSENFQNLGVNGKRVLKQFRGFRKILRGGQINPGAALESITKLSDTCIKSKNIGPGSLRKHRFRKDSCITNGKGKKHYYETTSTEISRVQ